MANILWTLRADCQGKTAEEIPSSLKLATDQELQSDACTIKLLDRVFADDQKLMTSIQVFVKDLPPPEPEKAAHAPVSDLERLAASVHEVVDAPIKRHPNTAERAANLDAIYNSEVP